MTQSSGERPGAARAARWRGAAEMLAEVRSRPGVTRAEVARRLGVSSGTATEISARLRDARLIAEKPAPVEGRGRPTTVLTPHPQGPLVLAADLRHEDWRVALADITGTVRIVDSGDHEDLRPESVLTTIARALRRCREAEGSRVRAVSVALAATVSSGHLVQASTLGWDAVDLAVLTGGSAGDGVPVLFGNDSTLAGVAEARSGAAAGRRVALHLMIEVGLGGTLVVDGLPLTGATGAGGEYGHIPFGDPARQCLCGAWGCWELEVDGRALARQLGDPAPGHPVAYLRDALSRLAAGSRAEAVQAAADRLAAALGRGVGGLVNLHDPDVVTLGGLAGPVRDRAPDVFGAAYRAALMRFRRPSPPPVVDAVHGTDGPLHGAVEVGVDVVTSESALADWAGLISRG